MFKIVRSSERADSQPSKDTHNNSHACKVDGIFFGKSATAGPNPPVRRNPK